MDEQLRRGITPADNAQHGPQPTGPAQGRPSVGVLLVHGMGSAAPGDTLRSVGEPLLNTIRTLAGAHIGAVTELDPAGGEAGPAHVVVEIDKTEWVLAECHWGECFRLPRYSRICAWLLLAVPWTATSYARSKFAQRSVRQDDERASKARDLMLGTAAWLIGVILAPLLAGVVALVLLLLLPLSVLPVPILQRMARKIVGVLSGSLGDVYVLLSEGFDRLLVEQRLRRDLDYLLLTRGCDRVILVAHSAGSRLCHDVLKRSTADQDRRVELFVTFGQAVWRTKETELLAGRKSGRSALVLSIVAAIGLIVGGYLVSMPLFSLVWWPIGTWGPVPSWDALGVALLVLGIGAGGGCVHLSRAGQSRNVDDLLPFRVRDRIVLWRDYVASADPVPDGRMAGPEQYNPLNFQSVRLHNLRSVVRDHTSYVSSDVFLRCVARDVLRVGGIVSSGDDSLDVRWAARRRRTRWLSTARNTVLLAAAWVFFTASWWPAQVLDGRIAAPSSPDSSPAIRLAEQLAGVLPDALAASLLGEGADSPWRRKVLGLAAVTAVLYGLYHCLFLLWQRWDRRAALSREGNDPGKGTFLVAWVVLLIMMLGAAVVLGRHATIGSTDLWRVDGPTLGWAIPGSLVLGVVCLVLLLTSVLKGKNRDKAKPGDHWDEGARATACTASTSPSSSTSPVLCGIGRMVALVVILAFSLIRRRTWHSLPLRPGQST